MKFPELNDFSRTATQIRPLVFNGINKNEIIGDDELSGGFNLDSELIPAIVPRKPVRLIRNLESPQYFGIINNKQVYVDGRDFFFDGIKKGSVTLGKKSVVDFNGVVVIFPDKKYYDYVDDKFGSFTCPYDIDFATVHYNRIFGIKESNVYASKVGDFKVWDDYSGTEMDSWATDVYSPGDFTGITSYQDHVIFFKSDQMYELFGYTPSQFKILESAKIGCVDSRSISEVGGILFFMSEKGVQGYSGGFPRSLSEKLNLDTVIDAPAISDGRKYYVSINGTVYMYDTWNGAWFPYLNMDAIFFGKSSDGLFAMNRDGVLYKFEEGNEPVDWTVITKLFDEGSFRKKSVASIRLKAKMDVDAELKVFVSIDEGDFKLKKYIVNKESYHIDHREVFIVIPLERASYYQIKIEGRGRSVVYGEREFIVGSEK